MNSFGAWGPVGSIGSGKTEVIKQTGKLHVNVIGKWPVGVSVEPYKLPLKPGASYHKSLQVTCHVKNHGLIPHRPPHHVVPCIRPRESPWGPLCHVCTSPPGLDSASTAWTMCTTFTFEAGQSQAWADREAG